MDNLVMSVVHHHKSWCSTVWACLYVLVGIPITHAASAAAEPAAQTLQVDGVQIQLDLTRAHVDISTEELSKWVRHSVDVVSGYYGRFPVTSLRIEMVSARGGGIHGGTTWGSPDAHIRMQIGKAVTHQELIDDWMLIHELIHLTLPEVGSRHLWLAEGVATYVESIARVQAGHRDAQTVWTEFVRSMPQGLPKAHDRGLDYTHTWGRTYWGGALFCLLADVEIHRRTDNRFGLQDALRAIAQASDGLASEWRIEKVLATGDAAVGVDVLATQYQKMKDQPVAPDLPDLWRQLGVVVQDRLVRFQADAPLARVRDAIMTTRPIQGN